MTWRSWLLVVLVIGGGILLQIPGGGHDAGHTAASHPGSTVADEALDRPGERTVVLAVSGMT